jgi:hypothetical protein
MVLPGIAQGLFDSGDNGELFVAATAFTDVQVGDLLLVGSRGSNSQDFSCPAAPSLFGAGWVTIASRSGCSASATSDAHVTWISAVAAHQYVSGSVPSVSGTVGFRAVIRNTKAKSVTRAGAGVGVIDISVRKQPRCIIQLVNGSAGFTTGGFGPFSWAAVPALGQVDGRSRDAEYAGNSNRLGIWFSPYADPANVSNTIPTGGVNNVVFIL